MTPTRFTQCLEALRWTDHTLAGALQCDLSLVEAWESGDIEVPAGVAAWLEVLALVHEGAPPPKTWRGKRA
jgi:hypothetical protein